MMATWKPGDVARIRVGTGDWEFGLMRDDGVWGCQHRGERRDWEEVQVHPVVVIDPEDREQVKRLTDSMILHGWSGIDDQAPDDMQAALRSLIPPPKPDEPLGLGAVVEDAEGSRWVRYTRPGNDAPWTEGSASVDYADIAVVHVLSEGVVSS